MTDPIADMLTRIRNAKQRKHEIVYIPLSKQKVEIARILKEEGFIRAYKVMAGDPGKGEIRVLLKYSGKQESVITDLKRVSTPGRRVYVGQAAIPYVKRGLGIAILSTSKGMMTDRASRRVRLGGEILCYVW
ncbi:MAG: 30S ribosomal protein S8 [Nitrospira sp.]|nr:30S ribosomal protein S8 [Candidatus Manganitrophaceae bacterium]HIL35514.1 30S ribosomal protein S8 [Candidatus Manganitrophaceae bacterium]